MKANLPLRKCTICGKEFYPRHFNSKICSDACRKHTQLECMRVFRENKPHDSNCANCGKKYHKRHKALYCSDQCRKEMSLKKAIEYNNSRKKPVVDLAPEIQFANETKPVVERLNKNKPKAESVLVQNMIELNRNAPVHDRDILKKKNIVSPNLAEMEFTFHDKAMRCTYYFKTEEKYINFLNNNPQ